jgi:tetratricopeptide (TPR) repeat protein
MRITKLVFKRSLCILLAPALVGAMGVIFTPASAAGPYGESADSYSGVPTVGGEPAFATKADAMISTVDSYLQTKNFPAANQAAVELTELYPQYLKGWMLLGYTRSLTEDFAGSNEAYAKALELGAEAQVVHSRQAYNHIRLGEFAEARASYRRILEINDKDKEALKQLGYVESKLGDLDASSHYYRRALELSPDDTDLVLALARVEAKRGGNGSVRELLEKALLLDPDNTEMLGKLGVIYMKDKNYQAALEPLRKLVVLEPDNAKAHRNLAATYYQLGDKKNALDSFEKALALNDGNGDMDDLYGPLADCYLASAKSTEALGVIQKGLEKGVQQAWLYSLWGKILEDSKDYDGAIAKFSEAVSLQEAPWSDYAKKQIARQSKLKQREKMIAGQMENP